MPSCSVKLCKSHDKKKDISIKWFRFPKKNTAVRNKWIAACGSENVNHQSGRICSLHFTDNDYRLEDIQTKENKSKWRLNSQAVPTLFLTNSNCNTVSKRSRPNGVSKKAGLALTALIQETIEEPKENPNEILIQENYDTIFQENYGPEIIMVETITTANAENLLKEDMVSKTEHDSKMEELRKKLEILERENSRMEKELSKLYTLKSSLSRIFTKGQIQKLEVPMKKVNWSLQDITAAKRLYSEGPRTYRYLRSKKFPLPGPSTIRKWAAITNITDSSGIFIINNVGSAPKEK